jgi:nucleotide-binding universal stress UspA family protein
VTSADEAGRDRPVIVVGVDGSEPSKRALRWAVWEAQATGGEILAVTVWEPVTIFGAIPPAGVARDYAADALAALDTAVEEALGPDAKVEVRTRVEEGHPASELIKLSEDADLLVLGSYGRSAFTGILVGSVALHCVLHAACPVVVVRGPGKVAR